MILEELKAKAAKYAAEDGVTPSIAHSNIAAGGKSQ